jgi:DNA-binding SARP family transcriptional activator
VNQTSVLAISCSATTEISPRISPGHGWPRYREGLRQHALDAYTELADHTITDQAIELIRTAAAIDPLHKATHHRLITLLLNTGDRPAAVRLHSSYRDRLIRAGLRAGSPLNKLADRLSKPT